MIHLLCFTCVPQYLGARTILLLHRTLVALDIAFLESGRLRRNGFIPDIPFPGPCTSKTVNARERFNETAKNIRVDNEAGSLAMKHETFTVRRLSNLRCLPYRHIFEIGRGHVPWLNPV